MFAILKVAHYLFYEKLIIGGNSNYSLLTLWLPISLGMISLAIYRRTFMLSTISDTKGWFWKIFRSISLVVQGILVSYVIFCTISDVVWEQLNNARIEYSSIELIECKVTRFWSGKGRRGSDQINFEFEGHSEMIKVDYDFIKNFLDENPSDYKLSLELREGLNQTYVIDSWEIIKSEL